MDMLNQSQQSITSWESAYTNGEDVNIAEIDINLKGFFQTLLDWDVCNQLQKNKSKDTTQ